MRYSIISNCCGGADIYTRNHAQFNNPFVWSEVFSLDLISLIKNYNSIDFTNFDLVRKPNSTICGIFVDSKFTIWFPHYKYNPTCTIPIKKGIDVFYKRNYEYVANKYMHRIDRMSHTDIPYFVIFAYKDKIKDKLECEKIQELLVENSFNSLLFTPYTVEQTDKNKVIVDTSLLHEPAPTPGVYVDKYKIASMFNCLL